ncbi:hypothetical protein [Burkholderia ubonensis]|uniref:hypothetical protein n=1 Tax=Burkholderia ubonensis TaxID=101571 RepID=UPI0012F8EBC5|nr:hypothetical protein [Burkholderia ubonensis]
MRIQYCGFITLVVATTAASQAAPAGMEPSGPAVFRKDMNIIKKLDDSSMRPGQIPLSQTMQAPSLTGGENPFTSCNDIALRKRIAHLEDYIKLLEKKITILETMAKENGK